MFQRTIGFFFPHWTKVALVAVCLVVFARVASGQAFLPPAGEGNVTVTYQNLLARGHLDLNGQRVVGESCCDPTHSQSIGWEVEFGLSDRLALDASLPFIRSRYGGSHPHLVGGVVGQPQEWDDGMYHSTFQDFHVGVRFNVKARPLAITPFAEVIVPSHHYPSLAHAAVGKDLRAVVVGGAVGAFLDSVLPGLFFQTQMSYALVQEVIGIRPNRSRVDAEVGYFITPRLAVRFLESYQVTHHGVDLISFTPMTDGVIHGTEIHLLPAYRRYHDQLQRSNYLNLGGGNQLHSERVTGGVCGRCEHGVGRKYPPSSRGKRRGEHALRYSSCRAARRWPTPIPNSGTPNNEMIKRKNRSIRRARLDSSNSRAD